jgi:hypothetical protein
MPATEEQKNRLFKAAEAGDVGQFQEAAAAITDSDDSLQRLVAGNGANSLCIAAYAGQTDLCKYLLDELKFDINSTDGA